MLSRLVLVIISILSLLVILGVNRPVLSASSTSNVICQQVPTDIAGCQNQSALKHLVKNVTSALAFIAGILGVFMLIVGGFMFTTSSGNPDSTKRARSVITYAIIGLIIAIAAAAIVHFVLNKA